MEEVSDKRRTAIKIRQSLRDLPVGKDILVTTPDEIVKRGHVVETVIRAALQEGKVVYERR